MRGSGKLTNEKEKKTLNAYLRREKQVYHRIKNRL
jgi:hypothetical protein